MKHLFYIAIMAFSFSFTDGFAQDPKAETNRLMVLLNKLEGTYQVQIIDSRELPAIPLSLMDTIITKRDQNEIKYVWLKDNIRVKILPVKEITSSSFKGVTRISYINSSEIN